MSPTRWASTGSTASRLVDKAVAGNELQRRSLQVRQELLAELTTDLTDPDIDLLSDLLKRLGKRLGEMENRS
jgi:DNA-binding MarR family transcriptional regulator